MSEDMATLQREAMEAMKYLCESIGDRGCGGCPLDGVRREKNMDCEKACCYFPTIVIAAANQHKNATEQPKATSPEKTVSIQTNWEATAKRLQKENKRLQDELNAERQNSAKMEKDLKETRKALTEKKNLFEHVVGQRDAYREVLEWVLHDQKGGKNGI